MPIDFRGLAEAARASAERLVPAWLPDGKRAGHEWQSVNPTRGDRSAGSFSVNLATGKWGDFATDDAGGDLVSLYAYLFCDGDQVDAAKALAELLNMPESVPPLDGPAGRKPKAAKGRPKEPPPPAAEQAKQSRSQWVPLSPVPDDAPPPPAAHEYRGVPARTWLYWTADRKLVGMVCRFEKSDGGKEIVPLTFCRHEVTGKTAWRWLSFAEPRPLYGLDRLAARPEATVLLVEGEKCADAAEAELPDLVAVSWPGGGKAVGLVNWLPLAGRRVITWADSDAQRKRVSKADKEAGADPLAQPILPLEEQPGHRTMAKAREILHGLGCTLWDIPLDAPGTRTPGWDVADAIEEGLTGPDLESWVRSRAKRWAPPEHDDAASGGGGAPPPPGEGPPPDCGDPPDEDHPNAPNWRDLLVWSKRKDTWDDCLANVHVVLSNRPEWRGVLAYDEFALRVVKLKPPPFAGGEAGEWDAADDSRTAIWLTHHMDRMTPSSSRVAEAIEVLARDNRVHPVRDWLRALPPWDGVARLDSWICDFLGAGDSPYVRLVSRWYLISMVARVMRPGCKVDTCLVLEGLQGEGKSSVLRALAGEAWFSDTDLDLHSKDALAALQGVWLHEFAELDSLARSEASRQKSFLSRPTDKYRPVYGRRDIRAPRQVVFAGTVNGWEWNKDPTGGRRFWPVGCAEVNPVGVAAVREQLFAEALQAFDAGEVWWPDRDQQRELFDPEQLKREAPESLVDALHDWVYKQVTDFSIAQAAMDGLGCDASKLTRDFSTRIGIALRKLGCTRVERRNGMIRYWYRPPERKAATSEPAPVREEDYDRVLF